MLTKLTQLRFNFRAIWMWNVQFRYYFLWYDFPWWPKFCHSACHAILLLSVTIPDRHHRQISTFLCELQYAGRSFRERSFISTSLVSSSVPAQNDLKNEKREYIWINYQMFENQNNILWIWNINNSCHYAMFLRCIVISPWKIIWLYDPFCFNWWLIGRNYRPKLSQIPKSFRKNMIHCIF